MTFEKKVYTMEDNVRSISFAMKDLVKKLEEINLSLQNLGEKNQKSSDENSVPF